MDGSTYQPTDRPTRQGVESRVCDYKTHIEEELVIGKFLCGLRLLADVLVCPQSICYCITFDFFPAFISFSIKTSTGGQRRVQCSKKLEILKKQKRQPKALRQRPSEGNIRVS